MNTNKPLCVFHGNCCDGFGAAWVLHHTFGKDAIEFHAGKYGETPPNVDGRELVIVDFSYPALVMAELVARAAGVLVLDHHKTAIETLQPMMDSGQITGWFDIGRSGAGITWDWYQPGKQRPKLIDHIEDRDLWRFKLEGTREIQACLFSYPYDFEVWDDLMKADPADLEIDGRAIERKHHKDLAELLKVTTRRMLIAGYNVPIANLPYTLVSDAGHALAQGEAFAGCYWDTPEGRVFGLRSTDTGMDVSEIAKSYGGGGHKHAAGFKIPLHMANGLEVPVPTIGHGG